MEEKEIPAMDNGDGTSGVAPEPTTTAPPDPDRPHRNLGEAKRYFFDFLVIVAGIAVTFMISGWIGNSRDRKQLRSHLEALRVELEENLGFIEEMTAYYDRSFMFSLYLSKKRPTQHDMDSVYEASIYKGESSVMHYNPAFTYASSAYETLKTSGMMNMISDQAWSMEIIKCYKLLEEAKHEADDYMKRKNDAMFGAILENKVLFSDDMDILDPNLENYFYFLAAPYGIGSIDDCGRQLRATLSRF